MHCIYVGYTLHDTLTWDVPTLLSNAFYVWPGKQKTTARSKHILWPHELVSLVSLSFNIGHAWRPLAPPPVSFQVCAGRNFERADFTEHLQEHPVGNEQCWGLEIHQECHSPWRPSSRRLPAVRWSINNQLSKFIVETRKTNGAQYQPATLHSLLCGIFIDVYYYVWIKPCRMPMQTSLKRKTPDSRTLRRSL